MAAPLNGSLAGTPTVPSFLVTPPPLPAGVWPVAVSVQGLGHAAAPVNVSVGRPTVTWVAWGEGGAGGRNSVHV